LIASTAAVALGFYLYYKRMLQDKLKELRHAPTMINNNGHLDNKLDIEKQLPDTKILRGVFRFGQNSNGSNEISILDGNK